MVQKDLSSFARNSSEVTVTCHCLLHHQMAEDKRVADEKRRADQLAEEKRVADEEAAAAKASEQEPPDTST